MFPGAAHTEQKVFGFLDRTIEILMIPLFGVEQIYIPDTRGSLRDDPLFFRIHLRFYKSLEQSTRTDSCWTINPSKRQRCNVIYHSSNVKLWEGTFHPSFCTSLVVVLVVIVVVVIVVGL